MSDPCGGGRKGKRKKKKREKRRYPRRKGKKKGWRSFTFNFSTLTVTKGRRKEEGGSTAPHINLKGPGGKGGKKGEEVVHFTTIRRNTEIEREKKNGGRGKYIYPSSYYWGGGEKKEKKGGEVP